MLDNSLSKNRPNRGRKKIRYMFKEIYNQGNARNHSIIFVEMIN